ncbi:hypothetical protein [Xanthomonas translucens]|uniref:Uncharacterized protein n=1 Tax=Xanthomonas translucens pv. translucens TaxID=134875 RepID=A0ABW9KXY9_XANCT|nr:hypothetical protein [Xanthomonas translucens]QSQ33394.1 hypothetical protein ISN31_16305 [Xanthomonas translucens pv. translucens]QSQ45760.1 hypothetical protein ISN34_02210 [Xanthomonas translucens pv. translucens]UJB15190.1 hypothetical protein LTC53_00215 [Xanthomonas translucens pv. undulosa]UNU11053.1 hypothetical protein KBV71_18175 [Xanthomonas translucens pv. translucens]
MASKKIKKTTPVTAPTKPKGVPRNKKNVVATNKSQIAIYASPKISKAMEIIGEMKIFEGVKVLEVIEAAYNQGKKDGARDAFDHVQTGITAAQKAVPHKNPGKPKKK